MVAETSAESYGVARTRRSSHCAGKNGSGKTSSLEVYTSNLETKLALKSALLDEAVRLHQNLEARVLALEEGISWKDAQLEAVARQSNDAWNRANQELVSTCLDRNGWRERAEQLEEENCVLRDEILERMEDSQRIAEERQRLLDVQQAQSYLQSEAKGLCDQEDHPAAVGQLNQQLKESHQKIVLLEEQLRMRSGSEPRARSVSKLEVIPELNNVPFVDAWAAVGLGAADRVCGASPYLQDAPVNSGQATVDDELPEQEATVVEQQAEEANETHAAAPKTAQAVKLAALAVSAASAAQACPFEGRRERGQRLISTDESDVQPAGASTWTQHARPQQQEALAEILVQRHLTTGSAPTAPNGGGEVRVALASLGSTVRHVTDEHGRRSPQHPQQVCKSLSPHVPHHRAHVQQPLHPHLRMEEPTPYSSPRVSVSPQTTQTTVVPTLATTWLQTQRTAASPLVSPTTSISTTTKLIRSNVAATTISPPATTAFSPAPPA